MWCVVVLQRAEVEHLDWSPKYTPTDRFGTELEHDPAQP